MGKSTPFFSGVGGIDLTPEHSELIRGKLDLISLASYYYLVIFMLMFSTWERFFPTEANLLRTMWEFAISGMIGHIAFWGVDVDWSITKEKIDLLGKVSEWRALLTAIGITYVVISIAQMITIMAIGGIEQFKPLVKMQIIPQLGINVGAALAEEWIFAFGTFTFIYFVTRGNLKITLFTNGILFALFHSAVKFILYGNEPAFLPAIFISRVMLDILYYFSEGRVSTTITVHLLINVTRSLMRVI